jgi:hypothetical protein
MDRIGSVNESSDRRLGLVLIDSNILGLDLGSSEVGERGTLWAHHKFKLLTVKRQDMLAA